MTRVFLAQCIDMLVVSCWLSVAYSLQRTTWEKGEKGDVPKAARNPNHRAKRTAPPSRKRDTSFHQIKRLAIFSA